MTAASGGLACCLLGKYQAEAAAAANRQTVWCVQTVVRARKRILAVHACRDS